MLVVVIGKQKKYFFVNQDSVSQIRQPLIGVSLQEYAIFKSENYSFALFGVCRTRDLA